MVKAWFESHRTMQRIVKGLMRYAYLYCRRSFPPTLRRLLPLPGLLAFTLLLATSLLVVLVGANESTLSPLRCVSRWPLAATDLRHHKAPTRVGLSAWPISRALVVIANLVACQRRPRVGQVGV